MKTAFTLVALLALATAPALAAENEATAPVTGGTAMSPASDPMAPAVMAPVTDAKTYVGKAMQGNLTEIEASKLAAERTTNAAVLGFATMMVEDHGNAAEKVSTAAKTAGIDAPTSLDTEHQQHVDALKPLSGPDFDRSYVDLMTDGHKQSLALHQGYSASGDTDGLKAVAASLVPTVQKHMAALDKIRTDINTGATLVDAPAPDASTHHE